ncbi:pyridoxamine 5'-phosphate oxidase family protein [Streptacidiphilus sp. P02-A3a]|uniref:pyridoxamine 5'-phosphate oxidase family protein n=1 Tax=Streptacidiphilus sp. P02-A3a TaxID=2704468 RepID=UPI0015FD88C8|nr:pyridoxamine 5'-phosphate oxidase family protein [Streptacidiphilus sp. P02-A3a]QMU70025.1 pyridoxamine 5'-phosphate oxidase family protein [Streptacidiphilus sp. P02-A3a]
MTELTPLRTKNLDTLYGTATLEWERVEAAIAAVTAGPGRTWFLGTVRADGRPHAAGIGHIWHRGAVFFTTGPGAQKTRNLLADPRCTLTAGLTEWDFVFEGRAVRESDPGVLATITAKYREIGWPAEAQGDVVAAPYSAPSAGPGPWQLYRMTVYTVTATAMTEPQGVTKWWFR